MTVTAQVLQGALAEVLRSGPQPALRIGPWPAAEPALRDGLEQTYRRWRRCPRTAPSGSRWSTPRTPCAAGRCDERRGGGRGPGVRRVRHRGGPGRQVLRALRGRPAARRAGARRRGARRRGRAARGAGHRDDADARPGPPPAPEAAVPGVRRRGGLRRLLHAVRRQGPELARPPRGRPGAGRRGGQRPRAAAPPQRGRGGGARGRRRPRGPGGVRRGVHVGQAPTWRASRRRGPRPTRWAPGRSGLAEGSARVAALGRPGHAGRGRGGRRGGRRDARRRGGEPAVVHVRRRGGAGPAGRGRRGRGLARVLAAGRRRAAAAHRSTTRSPASRSPRGSRGPRRRPGRRRMRSPDGWASTRPTSRRG